MFIDREGRLAVYLIDVSQLPAARVAIESVFGADQVPAEGVRALQGRFTVSQLKRWAMRAAALLQVSGVVSIDLDESSNRVGVGVDDGARVPAVESALRSLDIPREAVEINVSGKIRALPSRSP
jgi:hypothetical protein